MNTEKLKILLYAIEKGSLSGAAEYMNYTPSAISRGIESLEKELGIDLLTRSKSGVKMTAEAERLLPDIRRMFQDERILREHANQIAKGVSGTIRLGVAYPAFYSWISSMMARYQNQYPDVHYIVKNGFSSDLMEQVHQNEIDLCLISRRDTTCGWVPLLEDELVAILPLHHPLAQSDVVPIDVYADAPYLDLHSDQDTDNARALRAAGIRSKHALAVDDSSALYPMVEAGLGIGMENRINTLGHTGQFVIRPLEPAQTVSLGIAYLEDRIPVVRKFIEYLAESRKTLLESIAS